MDRKYTDDMAEISGFGGGYEEGCRHMVLAGLDWFDKNPDAKPLFSGFKGVYGLVLDDNEDAKALTKAICDAEPDCTGAMHQACLNHVWHTHLVGWEKYVEEMKALKIERDIES